MPTAGHNYDQVLKEQPQLSLFEGYGMAQIDTQDFWSACAYTDELTVVYCQTVYYKPRSISPRNLEFCGE